MVRIPSVEAPPVKDPVAQLLDAFSAVASLQAKASIRVDTVRKGQEYRFLLTESSTLKNRISFASWVITRSEWVCLISFTGVANSSFSVPYRTEPIPERFPSLQISLRRRILRFLQEKPEGSEVPNRIRIEMPEKETRLDMKLKEISVNQPLPENLFEWEAPGGSGD